MDATISVATTDKRAFAVALNPAAAAAEQVMHQAPYRGIEIR